MVQKTQETCLLDRLRNTRQFGASASFRLLHRAPVFAEGCGSARSGALPRNISSFCELMRFRGHSDHLRLNRVNSFSSTSTTTSTSTIYMESAAFPVEENRRRKTTNQEALIPREEGEEIFDTRQRCGVLLEPPNSEPGTPNSEPPANGER